MTSISDVLSTINQARVLYGDLRGTSSADDGLTTDSEERSGEDIPPTQVVEDDDFPATQVVLDDDPFNGAVYENATGEEVDRYYEPEEPALIRTPDGVELLRTTREKREGQRFYLKVAAVRARGYSDFQDLKCGSNGCVYSVYSEARGVRVALKVGSVGRDEVMRHSEAARLGLAPRVLDSFPVTVGLFDKYTGFASDTGQYAIVTPLMTPINEYVKAHGAAESLVDAWRRLVNEKNRSGLYHGDWHWGNVVLDVAPRRSATGLAPRVRSMLLIDWDALTSTKGARPATLKALLRLDAVYQYSQYLTAYKPVSLERQQLAVKGGMLRYFLGEPARNAKTTGEALRKMLQFARELAVAALNASNGSIDSIRIMNNTELFRFVDFKFFNLQPLRVRTDPRTNLTTYS